MSSLFSARWFRIYVVPGAVVQSVMVAGGYGTGRETVEYFTNFGFLGGTMGIGVAFLLIAVVLSLTFELSRIYRVYDYRNFFKLLLGRGWVAYEVIMILFFVLVLAVLASAAGNILQVHLHMPYFLGLSAMLILIGVLTFYGRELIAKVLTFWSLFLYVVFISYFVIVFSQSGDVILRVIGEGEIVSGWATSGFKYGAYNIASIPLLLYVVRGFESRREALVSGVVGAVIAVVPGLIFHVAFQAEYPDILQEEIPIYWSMVRLGTGTLLIVYSVMLFGTFIETGAGMLQGINDRLDAYLTERNGTTLSRSTHAVIAVAAVGISSLLSLVGITKLIAQGYGTIAWGFFAVYVIPVVVIGLPKILKSRSG
ncbi:MAG: hypothetical protein GXP15_03585 [Gammaproteobacteria bacterium]|nr:hypothetical protein [Gammaproteobacteria bacterium]